jgi:NADH dehydrogenase FAD-containing subunit
MCPGRQPDTARVRNIKVLFNVDMENITAKGIKIKYNDSKTKVIPYDTLIISTRFGQMKRNDSLFNELQGKVPEIYKIGDCADVKGIQEAVWSANEVARKMTYIELNTEPDYMSEYTGALFLPHTDIDIFHRSSAA